MAKMICTCLTIKLLLLIEMHVLIVGTRVTRRCPDNTLYFHELPQYTKLRMYCILISMNLDPHY